MEKDDLNNYLVLVEKFLLIISVYNHRKCQGGISD